MTKREKNCLALHAEALELQKEIKALEARLSTLKNELSAHMVDNKVTVNGRVLAEIVTVNGSISVDVKRLQVELPDVFRQFLKEGKPSQRFYIK